MNEIPLKANNCFAMLDAQGFTDPAHPRVAGFFLHDTRHLSAYRVALEGCDMVQSNPGLGILTQYWSRFEGHGQTILAQRSLTLTPEGFADRWTLRNESLAPQSIRFQVSAEADFLDVFTLRGRKASGDRQAVRRTAVPDKITFNYEAQDGIKAQTALSFRGFVQGEVLILPPGAEIICSVNATFHTSLEVGPQPMTSVAWTSDAMEARAQAPAPFEGIEALASTSAHGTFITAGVPNFVTAFGRDSLISAWFLLNAAPDVAAGTLRLLAAHQGTATDAARVEAPGKIPHELRLGEMARTGDVPFGRYYGTADATSLFLIVLRDHALATGDRSLVTALASHLRAALGWIEAEQDPDGLIWYQTGPSTEGGLGHLSWKDSDDSVSHADGSLAEGPIAVVEIQGYAAAALDAGAQMLGWLAEPEESGRLETKAQSLRDVIDGKYWSADLGLHAIALDATGAPFTVATSNPGHLLWAGVVTKARAAEMTTRMMQPDLWSGWGLRTLSDQAARYQPLSYHNGSVWPHDTGLFAAGLARYGHADAFALVKQALQDIAARQPGGHLPELFGGYARNGSLPPLPYIESCRPQGWAAAAQVWLEMAKPALLNG